MLEKLLVEGFLSKNFGSFVGINQSFQEFFVFFNEN
jgi:hypothetical protein